MGVWDGQGRDTLHPNAAHQGNGDGGALGGALDAGASLEGLWGFQRHNSKERSRVQQADLDLVSPLRLTSSVTEGPKTGPEQESRRVPSSLSEWSR